MAKEAAETKRPWTKNQLWIMAFVLMSSVFLCGAIVGGTATSWVLWHRTMKAFRAPGSVVERMVHDVRREYSLSEDQSRKLEELLAEHHEAMQAIQDEFQPRIEEQLESLRTQVQDLLSPEQRERWNSRFDQMKTRWMRPGPGGGPPPPHHGQGPPPGGFEQTDANNDATQPRGRSSVVQPMACK